MPNVVVAGAGPAGATAALTLARAGRSVWLVGGDAPAGPRVGEALPPAARPLLHDLGLLARVEEGGHLPCLGNVSVWGTAEPATHDFLRDPHGSGWHLDRGRFDAGLCTEAEAAGAHRFPRARVAAAERTGSGWRLRLREGEESTVDCRWLVDATGRGGALARRLGAVRRRQDRLVAFVARFRARAEAPSDRDARTWIEAAPGGWWYTARVPTEEPLIGERVVAFHADADLVRGSGVRTPEGFAAGLARAPRLHALLSAHGYRMLGRPRGVDAGSTRLDPAVGEGFLAVGDAALSFDPLSSQGLFHALYTGWQGGEAIHAALAGDASAPASYGRRLDEIHRAYVSHLAVYYAAEQRWPGRPFWARRRGERILTGASGGV